MKAQYQFGEDVSGRMGVPAQPQPLAPLLAGARARGMADAFELLGVAAAFLDEAGFALHINDHARRVLGPQLWVDDGRLRAADGDLDDALGAAIEQALLHGAHGEAQFCPCASLFGTSDDSPVFFTKYPLFCFAAIDLSLFAPIENAAGEGRAIFGTYSTMKGEATFG